MVDKEFVPYEESLELKKLGFDEPCFGFCMGNNKFNWFTTYKGEDRTNSEFINSFEAKDTSCTVPTYSQAFRWFRERWGYDIHVKGTNFRASYVIGIPKEINMGSGDGYPLVIDWDYIVDGTGVRKTYDEAELACLRKMIELVKSLD